MIDPSSGGGTTLIEVLETQAMHYCMEAAEIGGGVKSRRSLLLQWPSTRQDFVSALGRGTRYDDRPVHMLSAAARMIDRYASKEGRRTGWIEQDAATLHCCSIRNSPKDEEVLRNRDTHFRIPSPPRRGLCNQVGIHPIIMFIAPDSGGPVGRLPQGDHFSLRCLQTPHA